MIFVDVVLVLRNAVRWALGMFFLCLAAKVLYVLALMPLPPGWAAIHVAHVLPALGLVAVGTLLLDGRGK